MQKADIRRYLQTNEPIDIQAFILKNPLKLPPELLQWAARQWQFTRKLATKVPSWANLPLETPPGVSVEQASSEITARFKASLATGKTGADLTGGLGVDSYFFARQFDRWTYVEKEATIAAVAQHNFSVLDGDNIQVVNDSAEDFLSVTKEHFDFIYLDPARRDERGGKVFRVEDCQPDVPQLLPELRRKTNHLLIKYAPLLDIKAALQSLPDVSSVYVVAVANDVKEVLYDMREAAENNHIITLNFTKETEQRFAFTYAEESAAAVDFISPADIAEGAYLYEPNAAIMKAGAFRTIAERFGLAKIAPNTHLYVGNGLLSDFPGRIFRVKSAVPFHKKTLAKRLKGQYLNVSCRNFPLKPEALKQTLGYQDGGDNFAFFVRNQTDDAWVLFTEKVTF